MPKIVQIRGIDRLFQKLDKLRRDSERKNNGNVVVGYTAAYAIYVHENLEAKHGAEFNAANRKGARRDLLGRFTTGRYNKETTTRGANQQAKFLEKPARELKNSGAFARAFLQASRSGANLIKSLLIVGRRLQRESQQIVPVDTGNLKNSAFTEKE